MVTSRYIYSDLYVRMYNQELFILLIPTSELIRTEFIPHIYWQHQAHYV